MNVDRAELDIETLLKIVLGLVAVLLVLHIVGLIVSSIANVLVPLVTIAIALVIVLWLLDML